MRNEATRLFFQETKQQPVRIVDEIHRMCNDVLEELRLFANFGIGADRQTAGDAKCRIQVQNRNIGPAKCATAASHDSSAMPYHTMSRPTAAVRALLGRAP